MLSPKLIVSSISIALPPPYHLFLIDLTGRLESAILVARVAPNPQRCRDVTPTRINRTRYAPSLR